MRARMDEKKLRRFYRMLSVPMIDFNCGELCAPRNGGIPNCCESESVVPVLFRDELRWHRKKNGNFWKKMPVRTKADREFVKDACSYYLFAVCGGPGQCRRPKRSLNCMTFPFEPHVDREGRVVGLVYKDEGDEECPLMKKSPGIYNPDYISNSIRFWQELIDLYEEEQELYMSESRKRERRVRRKGIKVRVFRAGNGTRSFYLK
jgi:hypothetical protein